MHKRSVPISIISISDTNMEQDLNKYLDYFNQGKIDRVFICVLLPVYSKNCEILSQPEKFKKIVQFFKKTGIETGVWLSGFGHGGMLSHEESHIRETEYQYLTSVNGDAPGYAYCPLDDNFANNFMSIIKRIAEFGPDFIMIDDDFRLNGRPTHYMGCFCPKHLEQFYQLVGETVPRDEIEEKVFTGGKNKYRDAYMDMSRKTMLDFAKKVRATIDEVNPHIRAGACMAPCNWDFSGVDGIEIARALAGNTKPFCRPFGAPYWDPYGLIDVIEDARMQMNWIRTYGNDVEAFAEGDVYPRPRYNVPSKSLELYDLALFCDGNSDGILTYLFPYDRAVGYEEGYINRHIKNLDMQDKIKALFEDKTFTGVTIFSAKNKVREWVLPETLKPDAERRLEKAPRSYANSILPKNGIPVCYGESNYPVGVFGESARHIPLDKLSNGAILDSVAAMILRERGVDTGILGINPVSNFSDEYYIKNNDKIRSFHVPMNEMVCDDAATVLTELLPGKTPGSYTYENKDGIKFFVLAGDFQFSEMKDANYYNNYYRQEQVKDAIEWISGKRLPAVCLKNPNLYIMSAVKDHTMSVLMMNIFMDEIDNPVIILDKEYKHIKFVNCSGELKGDKVYLSGIPAYGFAAFEVE